MSAGQGAPSDGWFDSHCHLQEHYLPEPLLEPGAELGAHTDAVGAALARARSAGVDQLVCVGTDAATSAQALALAHAVGAGGSASAAPVVWATVGLHPHDAARGTAQIEALLVEAKATQDPALIAVGECGLDYHYDHSSRAEQRAAFATQIALATAHGLTLVVHARDAWDDLFDVLSGEGVPERTILHCFTGGPSEVRRCLDSGMFVSFSGIVTFKNATDVQAAAVLCPLDRLLIETDSPFLAPVPHRGRSNEPALVPLVGKAVAALKGLSPGELARSSAAAARAAFALSA